MRAERQGGWDAGEAVVIDEFGAAGAIAAHLGGMLDVGENIVAVGFEILLQRAAQRGQTKFMSGDKIAAIAGALNRQAQDAFFFHAEGNSAAVVLKDLLQLTGLGAAALVHAIEALRVSAGVIPDFQLAVVAHLQLVRDLADLHAGHDVLGRIQVLVGQFETMVPEGILPRAQFLNFFPFLDGETALAGAGLVILDRMRIGQVGMAGRRVSQDQRVLILVVLKIIIDSLFFHEPAGEVEIRFAILNAVVAGLESALDLFEICIQTREDFFQDIGHAHVLKDSALSAAGKQPHPGNQFHSETGEVLIALALNYARADAVEKAFFTTGLLASHS